MVRFLDGVFFAGGAPYGAVRDYCQSLDISPDDIDFDSLYKSYQKKSARNAKKTSLSVPNYLRLKERPKIDLEEFYAELCCLYSAQLYDKKNRLNRTRLRQFYIYADMKVNNLSPKALAKRHRLHFVTIYRMLNNVELFFIESNEKTPQTA